jgi:hypothetical protein
MYNASNAQADAQPGANAGTQPGADGAPHSSRDNGQSADDVTDVDFEEVK